MVFLFRDKSIINIFFLAILSIGIHIHFFIAAPLVITHTGDGFFSWVLDNYIKQLPQPALFMLYHALIVIQAIRLNMVLNDLRMYQLNSYVAAMSYVLLSAILPEWCSITPALLANFLLIWLFTRLCRLFNNPSPKTLLFNTGLIVGLSVIFYHPTAVLIIVVLFALIEIRPFNVAEWVVLLMGITLPYYFLVSWFFLTDNMAGITAFIPFPQWTLPVNAWSAGLIISLSVIFVLLLLGMYYWQLTNKRMVIQIRKNWALMLMLLLILLTIPFIFMHAGIESGLMALVPVAAFTANAFSYPRRYTLPNILFWLCIAVIAYNNWVFISR